MSTGNSTPNRQRAHESRKVAAGGRRMPGGVLPATAAESLARLQAVGYAGSATGCIARALVEASAKLKTAASR